MKVVASTGARTFLVEATAEELDNLAGHKVGEDQREFDSVRRKILFGTTFNISSAWQRLHRDQTRKDQVEAVKQNLRSILVSLEMIDPLIEEPAIPEPSKETLMKAAECTCR